MRSRGSGNRSVVSPMGLVNGRDPTLKKKLDDGMPTMRMTHNADGPIWANRLIAHCTQCV